MTTSLPSYVEKITDAYEELYTEFFHLIDRTWYNKEAESIIDELHALDDETLAEYLKDVPEKFYSARLSFDEAINDLNEDFDISSVVQCCVAMEHFEMYLRFLARKISRAA